tara:strand:+ start:126 stop:242 length:117 start_codon:yes stop_codon:yes gene_type:complete
MHVPVSNGLPILVLFTSVKHKQMINKIKKNSGLCGTIG